MIFLGIDPGGSGGLAVVTEGLLGAAATAMGTERDVHEWIAEHAPAAATRAVIEHVHAFPGQGVASCFTFGRSYGFLRGLLIAQGIPFEQTTPTVWQSFMGLLRKKKRGQEPESKTAKKNRHKALAQQWFPDLKVTHATADALLLAAYAAKTRSRGM